MEKQRTNWTGWDMTEDLKKLQDKIRIQNAAEELLQVVEWAASVFEGVGWYDDACAVALRAAIKKARGG